MGWKEGNGVGGDVRNYSAMGLGGGRALIWGLKGEAMNVDIVIEGMTPLLMHRVTEEEMARLLKPKQKKIKNSNEEKTPRQLADERVYRDLERRIAIPSSYLAGAFKNAASDYKQTDRGRKTMKQIAHVIFRPYGQFIPLLDDSLCQVGDFEVDIRPAVNRKANSMVVACRPRFDRWKAKFVARIDTELCSEEIAHQILNDAGLKFGIGSFRNGGFGQFRILKWEVEKELC